MTDRANKELSFFFNTEEVEYAVAWQLTQGLAWDEGKGRPQALTPQMLYITMKLLGCVCNAKHGSKKLCARCFETRTPWTKKTILKVLKLMQSAKLLTLLEGTENEYIPGEAIKDGRMLARVDHFNAQLKAGKTLSWPISSPAKNNSRKAKQAKKDKRVESSRTPGVESLKDPTKVESLEDPRVESLKNPTNRQLETTKENFLEKNNQKTKSERTSESDQVSPVDEQEQVTLAGRSPHSDQPAAGLRLERQPHAQPCSEQPQQQNDSVVESNDSCSLFKIGDKVTYIWDEDHEMEVADVVEGMIIVETVHMWPKKEEDRIERHFYNPDDLNLAGSTAKSNNERSLNESTRKLCEKTMHKR